MNGNPDRKAGVRRTAMILFLVAFAFYAGFILLGVGRA